MRDTQTMHQYSIQPQLRTMNGTNQQPHRGAMNGEVPADSSRLNALVARSAAVMGLVGMALIHLLDAGGKYGETRYIFWMYVALIATSVALTAILIHQDSRPAWLAVGALSAMTIAGYCLSRTTGLPAATGDIGNWGEPLGLASLLIEGLLVALAGYRLVLLNRPAERG